MTETSKKDAPKRKKDPRNVAAALLIIIGFAMGLLLIINTIKGEEPNISQQPQEEQTSDISEGSENAEPLSDAEEITAPSLKFEISGGLIKEYNLDQLRDELNPHRIELVDPYYGKKKRYEAFALQDVLQLGFGNKWESPKYTDVAFGASDGYTAIANISKLFDSGGYIVYEDLDYSNWEPISNSQIRPGPFYLVWTGEEQTTANEYPWPWQLASIDLIQFQSQFPKVIPQGANTDSPAYMGFQIFEGRCIRCHAINGQGGVVGPDLNAPQSIVSYRSENMIKEFIKNPSKYRHTHMPDHPDLSDQDLDNLISYFNYMNENRN